MISVEAGDNAPVKKLNGLVEGGSFDQILDLGDVADSNKALVPELPAPMMAFEESIQHQSQSAATAGIIHHHPDHESQSSHQPSYHNALYLF